MLNSPEIDYAIELDAVDLRATALRASVTNRSPVTWHRDSGIGELRVGYRLFDQRTGTVLVDGRADLPETVAPSECVGFDVIFTGFAPVSGYYRLEIDLLYEHRYWWGQVGGTPFSTRLVIPDQRAALSTGQAFGPDPEHPYRGLPSSAFWKSGVAEQSPETFNPVPHALFMIGPHDRVAAAGSCFAQHIATYLKRKGFGFLQIESADASAEPMPFSANYGNVYTALQLHQLLLRAFGILSPADIAWQRADGRYIDPFRPQLYPEGFADEAAVCTARDAHLLNVRRVFLESDILVFTLGLTEAWMNGKGGIALPLPPGAVANRAGFGPYIFKNFSVEDVVGHLDAFIADVRSINPELKMILTVSPVPLVATYEDHHVLLSNTVSKSILRVAADIIAREHDGIAYFPSFEIITSPVARGAYFADDLRSVTSTGVDRVMTIFAETYLGTGSMRVEPRRASRAPRPARKTEDVAANERGQLAGVLCDEQLLDGSMVR
jgi:hypothetical protein